MTEIKEKHMLTANVDEILKDLTATAYTESIFCGMIMETEASLTERIVSERSAIQQLLTSLAEDQLLAGCKAFAEHIYKQENPAKVESLLEHLEHLIKQNLVSPKPVCEALLGSSYPSYSDPVVWCAVFRLVHRVIGGVDYKGCRDIFRVILEKCRTIPASDSASNSVQIRVILEVVQHILNRNVCLLPSYFAINEIIKLSQHEEKPPVHWAFGKLLADFTQSFRPTAQIVTISGLSSLRPVIGHSNINAVVWRLDLRNLRFPVNGPLPYDRDKAQSGLIRYVLSHAYAVDFMTSILIANRKQDGKHRCTELEEQLCDHIVHLMETQSETAHCDSMRMKLRWQNLTAQMIFFVLYTMISFPHMIQSLYKKLEGKNTHWSYSRDHLMWLVMQFIFGVGKAITVYEFIPFLKLYDLLYPDKQELLVPDFTSLHSVHSMAVLCIWTHMRRKCQLPEQKLKPARPFPASLRAQLECVKEMLTMKNLNPASDFRLAALCNAYSTSESVMVGLLAQLVDAVQNSKQTQLPHGIACFLPVEPLSIAFLDALSVHSKMLFIQQIFAKIDSQIKGQSQVALSPSLVETCARLLVYTEIEQTCGIKTFVTSVLPSVFAAKCQPVINAMLEMSTYRLNHVQPHYRMKILSSLLDELGTVTHNQLHTRYEHTAACLLLSLGNVEVQQQVYRSVNEKKFALVSRDSEELNRLLVLTLARAINAIADLSQAGSWCKNLLTKIHEQTPHNWSAHTMTFFPPHLQEFFSQNHAPAEDKIALQKNVETDFNRWRSQSNETDTVQHFSRSERMTFLCVLWKCALTGLPVQPAAYKVLEALGIRALSVQMRTLADYFISQLQLCNDKAKFVKATEAVSVLSWKYNIFPLDRFVLCLSLRPCEMKDAQVSLYAMQLLLSDTKLINSMKEFASTASPEHWKCTQTFEVHSAYHQKYPEKCFYEGILESNNLPVVTSNPNLMYLPSYMDNICLRLLSVIDVVLHRLLETLHFGTACEKALIPLLREYSRLYRFHDQPITYLYNTLHYYHKLLLTKYDIKKKLVLGIMGGGENKVTDSFISAELKQYLSGDAPWSASERYFYDRVTQLVNMMSDDDVAQGVSDVDWRFTEFTSAPARVLYTTCVELMCIPLSGQDVGAALIDVLFKWNHLIPRGRILSWMNAVALIITALPESCWQVVFTHLVQEFKTCSFLSTSNVPHCNPFEVFSFTKCCQSMKERHCTVTLALIHTIWHHFSIGQLSAIPQFIRDQVKPVINTEEEFLYLCHLIGPFLHRFQQERARCCIDLTIELYEILERVDRTGTELFYMDSITDFFYHIKYMFVGDEPKLEVEKIIKNLRTSLQLRLRFIAHHTTTEGAPTPN